LAGGKPPIHPARLAPLAETITTAVLRRALASEAARFLIDQAREM
jgi:hypothetical protein